MLLIACIIYGGVTYNQRKGTYRVPAMVSALIRKAGRKKSRGLLPSSYISSVQASPRRGFPGDGNSRTASGDFYAVNVGSTMTANGSGQLGSEQLPVSVGGEGGDRMPMPGRAASIGATGHYGSGEMEERAGGRGGSSPMYQMPSGNSPTARGPAGSPRRLRI